MCHEALRNKSYGPALEFVWAHSGAYATRDSNGKITVFQARKRLLEELLVL